MNKLFKFLNNYKNAEITVCKRCIYDSRIPRISFDNEGICDYCRQYDQMMEEYPIGQEGEKIIAQEVEQAKDDGRGKPYDIVIGVSGGADSSYMLHLAKKKYGLRVLAAHFDNTYNSRIAVENIDAVLDKLEIDLYTHVVDNIQFQRIYKSFFKASVPEIDTPTDLALATVLYDAAEKYGIKHIWEGHSFRTEGISPAGWFYMDAMYIKRIHEKYGDGNLGNLPVLWLDKWIKWITEDKIKKFRPLYYLDYNKEENKKMLAERYDWQWYGGHHMENRTAYFVNNYYLPNKFGIDLRYSEFSALIRAGMMQRDEALKKIKEKKVFDNDILEEIKKRCEISDFEWNEIMEKPPSHYTEHETYKKTFEEREAFFYKLYQEGYVTKSFYYKFCVLKD
ncbi:MAG: N-acetyl sugar amidotransferase [Desulfobacula sp.]|nr:N-acetyl sugar amidotransferase [Desulfobacula sp.]